MVVLAVGAVRFNGGGETLPSSVARRLRVGGIFVYAEVYLQVDEWNLRACTLANSITLITLLNCHCPGTRKTCLRRVPST